MPGRAVREQSLKTTAPCSVLRFRLDGQTLEVNLLRAKSLTFDLGAGLPIDSVAWHTDETGS